MILIIDFGGQYNQLVARRVREAGVYAHITHYSRALESIIRYEPKGIVLTGGPSSVNMKDSPRMDEKIYDMGIPILGICYGAQLIAKEMGGVVTKGKHGEYGMTKISLGESMLYQNIDQDNKALMSHFDLIEALPKGFHVTATTENTPVASFEDPNRKIYGLQFHPEVDHTSFGDILFNNFLYDICEEKNVWNMENFKDKMIQKIRDTVGDKRVIMALSGGVDSSVTAMLLHQAIGSQFTSIFVDHGLLRKNEAVGVEQLFAKHFGLNLITIDAKDIFLRELKGVTDPEKKRKIIGKLFIDIFEKEALSLPGVEFLAQGTIYPDVIESGTDTSHTIKSHHNVGGLPDNLSFELLEPLRDLFKDEVRELGLALGLSRDLVFRQPFPGPGLAIRVMGEITEEKLEKVRESDAILREEIRKAEMHNQIWQYFTVLTGVQSVGVMGDERTYSDAIAIRAVLSRDGMTGDFAKIPYDVLERIALRIVNEVPGVNRIVYDITPKPPSTIEWE